MMHRVLLLLAFVLVVVPARAQTAEPDTSAWVRSLTGKLSLTQAGFRDWADGGVSTLAASSGIDGKAERTSGAWTRIYELRAGFGLVRQDTLAFRKAEDLIVIKAEHRYAGRGFFGRFTPTIAFAARSQFWEGFDYDAANALPDGSAPKVSDFMAPASFIETIGLTNQPAPWVSMRLGVSSKQTVVAIERLRPLYSMDLDQSVRVELGLEFVTDVDKNLAENIHYKSSFGAFAAFNQPESPDLIWENLLEMKVNSWLTTNFEWAMLLDRDRSDALQMREVLSIGIVYHFL